MTWFQRVSNHLTSGPLLAIALATVALLVAAAESRALQEGQRAPRFELPALDGQGVVSLQQYRGKVVYLDFWASWCPPCRTAMPVIEELRKEFPAEDFQVVAINVDSNVGKAKKLIAKEKVGYPSASDPGGKLPKRFKVKTMPTSFLIDRNGVVRYVHEGFRRGDDKALRAEIRKLLAKKGN